MLQHSSMKDFEQPQVDPADIDRITQALDLHSIVFLSAPSGWGKSTLLRHYASFIKGSYFDHTACLYTGSIEENIFLGQPDKQIKYEMLFDDLTFPFKVKIENINNKLSNGQRQRVAFVRNCLSDADTLIFDESLSGLDEHSLKTCLSWLVDYVNLTKKKCILVNHGTNESVDGIGYLCLKA